MTGYLLAATYRMMTGYLLVTGTRWSPTISWHQLPRGERPSHGISCLVVSHHLMANDRLMVTRHFLVSGRLTAALIVPA